MTQQSTTYEKHRLREVAHEYRKQGYEVFIKPTPDQLPDFLAHFPIDIVARNNEENVVIEVRTRDSLTSTPKLDAIAKAILDRSSWRLDLVVGKTPSCIPK